VKKERRSESSRKRRISKSTRSSESSKRRMVTTMVTTLATEIVAGDSMTNGEIPIETTISVIPTSRMTMTGAAILRSVRSTSPIILRGG